MNTNRLERPNGVFLGVCEGIARWLGMDTWLVRALWLVSIFALGTGVIAYFILAFFMPREGEVDKDKYILGVSRKVSDRLEIDLAIVRSAMAFLTLSSAGTMAIGYIILHFILEDQSITHS